MLLGATRRLGRTTSPHFSHDTAEESVTDDARVSQRNILINELSAILSKKFDAICFKETNPKNENG